VRSFGGLNGRRVIEGGLSLTPRFNFIGAMTLALVLGGCASREELAARLM